MPPLPPYRFRPLKPAAPVRTGTGPSVKPLAESVSKGMSIKAGRLPVKQDKGLEKPQLKVLARD